MAVSAKSEVAQPPPIDSKNFINTLKDKSSDIGNYIKTHKLAVGLLLLVGAYATFIIVGNIHPNLLFSKVHAFNQNIAMNILVDFSVPMFPFMAAMTVGMISSSHKHKSEHEHSHDQKPQIKPLKEYSKRASSYLRQLCYLEDKNPEGIRLEAALRQLRVIAQKNKVIFHELKTREDIHVCEDVKEFAALNAKAGMPRLFKDIKEHKASIHEIINSLDAKKLKEDFNVPNYNKETFLQHIMEATSIKALNNNDILILWAIARENRKQKSEAEFKTWA